MLEHPLIPWICHHVITFCLLGWSIIIGLNMQMPWRMLSQHPSLHHLITDDHSAVIDHLHTNWRKAHWPCWWLCWIGNRCSYVLTFILIHCICTVYLSHPGNFCNAFHINERYVCVCYIYSLPLTSLCSVIRGDSTWLPHLGYWEFTINRHVICYVGTKWGQASSSLTSLI